VNYGFVIDNRSCIGCHACSTACKAENEVPLGVYRTWVKYVEKGQFPDNRRSFQVTRCNHCANPPCVRICPVTAMYQRKDGIVEFDPEVCIGCKACMQACPYDAIYMDPDTGTAAKCHYCAHRTDIGLEPACVVVCPTQAIIAGDLDDPTSRISNLVTRENVSVRKPEQGTMPKLFYIDGDASTMQPTASLAPGTFMWADLVSEQGVSSAPIWGSSFLSQGGGGQGVAGESRGQDTRGAQLGGSGDAHGAGNGSGGGAGKGRGKTQQYSSSGSAIRTPGDQGAAAWLGPIHFGGGSPAEHMVQTGYNAQHKVPWHWQVPAYLVTKAIGSGAYMLMVAFMAFGLVDLDSKLIIAGDLIGLVFIGLTTALLVMDLDRPERFLRILTRPQWKSWLTRGAFILVGFTGVMGLSLISEMGWLGASTGELLRLPLLAVGFVLAFFSAIYTAFLFGQCEGRDLWQSSLLPMHMLVQALMAGAATWYIGSVISLMVPRMWDAASEITFLAPAELVFATMFGFVAVDLAMLLFGEMRGGHASTVSEQALHAIKHGKYRKRFRRGVLAFGHVVPLIALALLSINIFLQEAAWQVSDYGEALPPVWVAVHGVLWPVVFVLWILSPIAVLIGLYLYEHAFVMAPQEVPNS
jgi:Fe-S-cluster-containing dehydrogenase component/formate-dependent nitrite reductase membrane component NrfD